MDREELERLLGTLDGSICFIIVIIASVLLSLLALRVQRGQLRQVLAGADIADLPSVFPLRLTAGALIIGALGFFFCLGLDRQRQAQAGDDPVERRSARLNAAASTLVLCAALLRLDDLLFVEKSGRQALLDSQDLPA